MLLTVTIRINDPEFAEAVKQDPERFKSQMGDAFDHYWDLERMGTVEPLHVEEVPEPSETEKVGPLG